MPAAVSATTATGSAVPANSVSIEKKDDKVNIIIDKNIVYQVTMINNKPASVFEPKSGAVIKVTTWDEDVELEYEATTAFPVDAVCDGSELNSARRRILTDYSPANYVPTNNDQWWLKILFGSGNPTNYNYKQWSSVKGIGSSYNICAVRTNCAWYDLWCIFSSSACKSVSGDYKAVLLKNDNTKSCAVSFSGTNDPADAVMDIDISTVTSCKGSTSTSADVIFKNGLVVHQGFCKYWSMFKAEVLQHYTKCKNNNYNVMHFMGHSLGGATATIAAADLQLNHGLSLENTRLHTAGAPRPFATDYTPDLGPNVIRFINRDDPVPSIVPTWATGFFTTNFFSHPKGLVQVCYPITGSYACDAQQDNYASDFSFAVPNHYAPRYLEYSQFSATNSRLKSGASNGYWSNV